jgi:hypothetical protein
MHAKMPYSLFYMNAAVHLLDQICDYRIIPRMDMPIVLAKDEKLVRVLRALSEL